MQQTVKQSLLVAAAVGALAGLPAAAHADTSAGGRTADSPGFLSGNSVQVPVQVPLNACGNTADLVGLLNPAFGNLCADTDGFPTPPRPRLPGRQPPQPHVPGQKALESRPLPSRRPATDSAGATDSRPHGSPSGSAAVPKRHTALAKTGFGTLGALAAAGAVLLTGGAALTRRGTPPCTAPPAPRRGHPRHRALR
ncbi:chaplin [Streptomyces sp. NPDC059788]|uniref:chaplin n=1 Tax=Streptomyces sp. NPDC059788 TaxID=3346948 RepID=UPI0036514531